MKKKNVKDNVDIALWPYFKYYKDGFTLELEDKIVPARINFLNELFDTETIEIDLSEDKIKEIAQQTGNKEMKGIARTVVKRKDLKLLFPENIDNKKFWRKLNPKYKLLSVSGATTKSEYEANKVNLGFAKAVGAIGDVERAIRDKLGETWNRDDRKFKVLEIGYGLGCFVNWLYNESGRIGQIENKQIEYYGIDIVKRIDTYENLFESDGWKIPKEIPTDLDMVYSLNVFQHLSKKQRYNYFKKAYKRLNNNGVMVFSSFIMTEQNKDSWAWGLVDEKGTGYCHFFNQPTEVDKDEELKEYLTGIGFEIEKFQVLGENHLDCVLRKRIRHITKEDPYGEEVWDEKTEEPYKGKLSNMRKFEGFTK